MSYFGSYKVHMLKGHLCVCILLMKSSNKYIYNFDV